MQVFKYFKGFFIIHNTECTEMLICAVQCFISAINIQVSNGLFSEIQSHIDSYLLELYSACNTLKLEQF